MSSIKIPRESKRAHQQELLKARVVELEGRLAEQVDEVRRLKDCVSERARKALLRADGTLSYLYYGPASGKRGAVLQISCKVPGLALLRTALTVDGKDFSGVYARAVKLLAEAFGADHDEELIKDMLATRDAFLKLSGLHLVEIKYDQVVRD